MDANSLFDAYEIEKQKDYEEQVKKWVHILRLHYEAAIKEGFTEDEAMMIVDMFWRRVEEKTDNNE